MIRSNIDEDIWNNTNQSLMSFVGYESEADGQFRCWDANQTIFNPNFPQPTMGFNQNINPYSEITHHSADFMKREEDQSGFNTTEEADYSMGRIGLKLGHRTYFSSREAAMIDRLFKRPRGFFQATQIPRCQAEGCKVDLTNAKHYHRRHKVCEFHSKAIRVLAGGAEQRFCQQCSRFHLLSEFDEMKRSCRKRLADHNRRRRKSQTGSSDSVSAKNTVNGFAQGSSSSSLNINEMSTSETLLFAMAKDEKANSRTRTCLKEQNHGENDETQFQKLPLLSSSYLHDEQKSFFLCANNSQFVSTNFLSNNSTYQNPFYSSSNEASPSTGGGSDHSQQHRNELQNMLHLGQSIFEVELL